MIEFGRLFKAEEPLSVKAEPCRRTLISPKNKSKAWSRLYAVWGPNEKERGARIWELVDAKSCSSSCSMEALARSSAHVC
jgi:hypothetical protein